MTERHDFKNLIVFDGICVMCNFLVDFIIKRDKRELFRFLPAQSPLGRELIQRSFPELLWESNEPRLIYIGENGPQFKSDAVISILANLGRTYYGVKLFYLIPRGNRDYCYQFIASRRYQWFGKKTECRVPHPSAKRRFLE